MRVCIVSFGSRKGGNCSQIGKFISSISADAELFDFSEFKINSCGNCAYQCFKGRSNCPYFEDKEREILDAVTGSTLTYFVVPNYCDFPCSNFFIFNERSLCYFQGNEKLLSEYLNVPKKFIVISNSNLENFKTAFAYHCNGETEILSLSAKKYGKVSIDGNLLTSARVVADLKRFIKE